MTLEQNCVDTVGEILSLSSVAPSASFFELGGTSLEAIQLALRLSESFDYDVRAADVYRVSSIAGLAKLIASRKTEPASGIPRPIGEESFSGRLNETQRARLMRLDRARRRGSFAVAYESNVITRGFQIWGSLDVVRLKGAIDTVIQRHTLLRSTFQLDGETGITVMPASYSLQVHTGDGACIEQIKGGIGEPFDFQSGQMGRFLLLKDDLWDYWEFWFAVEHMSFDGMSMQILLEDLSAAYEKGTSGALLSPPEPSLPGHKIGDEEERLCSSNDGLIAQAFWSGLLQSGPLWRSAPLQSWRRPGDEEIMSTSVKAKDLDEQLSRGLAALAARHNTSVQTLLTAAWAQAIRNGRRIGDVPIYTTVSNRGDARIRRTVGPVASAAMVAVPERPEATAEWLRQVAGVVHRSLAFSYYPVDRLARERPEHGEVMPDDFPILLLDVTSGSNDSGLQLSSCSTNPATGPAGHLTLFTLILAATVEAARVGVALVHPSGMLPEGETEALLARIESELRDLVESASALDAVRDP